MVHLGRRQDATWCLAFIVQLQRVRARYQSVPHPMHEERGRLHVLNLVDVAEPVLYQVLQVVPCLVLSYIANGFEGGHQEERAWFPFARYVGRRPTPNTPSQYDNVLLFDADHLVDVVVDVERRVEDVLLISFEHFFWDIGSVMNGRSVAFSILVAALGFAVAGDRGVT